MGALKTLVVDLPCQAELFGLNVSFELALLLSDVDNFFRFVGVCFFFHVMTHPVAVSNETSPRR